MKNDGAVYQLPDHHEAFFVIHDNDEVTFHWTSNDGDTLVDDITNTNLGRILLFGQHMLERSVIDTIKRVDADREAKPKAAVAACEAKRNGH